MAIQAFTIPNSETTIWAEEANINYFLKTPLTPDVSAGVSNKQANVRSFTRRQYPGDTTTSSVRATVRQYMFDPGRKLGRSLPGQSFVVVGDPGSLVSEEKRQFTYDGRWEDVHALFVSKAKMMVDLYSPRGVRYTVTVAAP